MRSSRADLTVRSSHCAAALTERAHHPSAPPNSRARIRVAIAATRARSGEWMRRAMMTRSGAALPRAPGCPRTRACAVPRAHHYVCDSAVLSQPPNAHYLTSHTPTLAGTRCGLRSRRRALLACASIEGAHKCGSLQPSHRSGHAPHCCGGCQTQCVCAVRSCGPPTLQRTARRVVVYHLTACAGRGGRVSW